MKIAILYLNTGGGHKSNAKALERGILSQYPDAEVVFFEALEDSMILSTILEGGYSIVAKNEYTKDVYRLIYELTKPTPIMQKTLKMFTLNIQPKINKFLKNAGFTHVISTHFLLSNAIIGAIDTYALPAKYYTLVTDPFTPHPMRFASKNTSYIVFSQEAASLALEEGVDCLNIHVYPTIIDTRFEYKMSIQEQQNYKIKIGFSPDEKCVLIVGGGDGINNGKGLLKEILEYPLFPSNTKYIFVCGKNNTLKADLESIIKLHKRESDFLVLGFTTEMYELMNIAELVVAKGGPATVFESISLEKPLLLYNTIGPQELGNVVFVQEHTLGIFETNYHYLPGLIHGLLSDRTTLSMYIKNIQNLGYKNGLTDIVKYITQ